MALGIPLEGHCFALFVPITRGKVRIAWSRSTLVQMGHRQPGLCLYSPGRRALGVRASGVVAGTVAVADGERWWGDAGVTASGGALIVSFYLAASLAA